MRVLTETAGMDRLEWLKWRRKGIGGSDVAAVMFAHPYRTPYEVWVDKTEKVPLDNDEDSLRMWVGNVMEDPVARRVAEEQNLTVRKRNAILQHDTADHVLASLDRLAYRDGKRLPLEIKVSWAEDSWSEGCPLHYQLQVMQQLAILGDDVGLLAALIDSAFSGPRIEYFRIDRDDEVINDMLEAQEHFWTEYVEKDIPPPIEAADIPQMMRVVDRIKDKMTIVRVDDANALINRYLMASETAKTAKKDADETKALLLSGMEDAEFGVTDEFLLKVSKWTTERLDTSALKEAHPDICSQFIKPSTSHRFTVKRIDDLPKRQLMAMAEFLESHKERDNGE